MSLIENLIGRLRRKTVSKPKERVLTFDRYEEMTATQALRFKDLQAAMLLEGNEASESFPDQPWYSLDDAGRRITATKAELLVAAAAGRILCFVYAGNADGYWDAAASTPVPASVPDLLQLPTKLCGEIARFGSANVKVLEFHHSAKNVLRYRLKKAAWVDADLLYLQHPLPDRETLSA